MRIIEESSQKEEKHILSAKTITGEIIQISDAESGRRGYFCRACNREMQAVKQTISGMMSYFRHDSEAMKGQEKCTSTNETHRHNFAKKELFQQKRIKLPAVYKYPPIGQEGVTIQIAPPVMFEAHSAREEVTVYEDEYGKIHIGMNPDIPDKYLRIRPDITLLDSAGSPVLLVEIVATHKVSQGKLQIIRRLGIDAVQVKVPPSTPEEIIEIFRTSKNTRWLFNRLENATEYTKPSEQDSEGLSPLDQFQREVFEETFFCRCAEVKAVIRAIRKSLDGGRLGELAGKIGLEIQRVERNTTQLREDVRDLEEKIREDVRRGFTNELEDVRAKLRKTRREEYRISEAMQNLRKGKLNEFNSYTGGIKSEFEEKYSGVEERYFEKRRKIEREENAIREEEKGLKKSETEIREIEVLVENPEIGVRLEEKLRGVNERRERIHETKQRELAEAVEAIARWIDSPSKRVPPVSGLELPHDFLKRTEAWQYIYDFRLLKSEEEKLSQAQEIIREGDWRKW